MFGGDGKVPEMELVRLALPRRVYTQSHIDYVIESAAELFEQRDKMVGLRMTNSPPFLRHFTATFEELT
jgi:tryptophanase